MRLEIGDKRRLFLLTHEDHHVGGFGTFRQERLHPVEHIERQLLLGALGERTETDISASFLIGLIELVQRLGRKPFVVDSMNQFLLLLVRVMRHDMLKKREVEVHHLLAAAVVTGEVREGTVDLRPVMRLVRSKGGHDFPIPVSPAVDRLFDIAHDEHRVSLTG